MRLSALSFAATIFTLAAVACSSGDSSSSADGLGDSTDQGSEQDLTSAKAQLRGAWTVDADSADLSSTVAYDFRPNGEFFRDSNRVLNGLLLPGATRPLLRETGTYSVNTKQHRITLHIDSPNAATEVLTFESIAGRVLNGVFLPGHAPPSTAQLKLTAQAAPGSHVAFPTITYDAAASYCTSDADCQNEWDDKTFNPGTSGVPTCDTTPSRCEMVPAIQDPNK